jgi:hypothetical protein
VGVRVAFVLIASVACSLVLAASAAHAQTLVVRVRDGSTQRPIEGAEVEVLGTDSVRLARVISDSAGLVHARLQRSGPFAVAVSHLGYLTYRSTAVPLEEGESIELEVRLGRNAIPLEPLVVVTRARLSTRLAGYRERLQRGSFGSFITREEIERRPTATVTDLIRPMAGVTIVDVARGARPDHLARLIAMRGLRSGEVPGAGEANHCLPSVLVDGVRVEQSVDFPIDDFIRANELEGIEIYSSAGQVPVQYQQTGRVACGAVLLWTRAGQPGEGRSGWLRWAVGLGAFAGIIYFLR